MLFEVNQHVLRVPLWTRLPPLQQQTESRYDADLCEYLLPDNSEEYAYVFRSGKWVCYDMHQWEDNKLPEVVEIPSGALAA